MWAVCGQSRATLQLLIYLGLENFLVTPSNLGVEEAVTGIDEYAMGNDAEGAKYVLVVATGNQGYMRENIGASLAYSTFLVTSKDLRRDGQ